MRRRDNARITRPRSEVKQVGDIFREILRSRLDRRSAGRKCESQTAAFLGDGVLRRFLAASHGFGFDPHLTQDFTDGDTRERRLDSREAGLFREARGISLAGRFIRQEDCLVSFL